MSRSKAEYWTTEDGLRLVRSWKRSGLRDIDIAEKIGICEDTLYEWKKRFPRFSEAFKKGLEDCIADAEEALFSKFQRQEVQEQQIETWEEQVGNGAQVVKKTHKRIIKKEILPDTTAIIFFLKCKAGWKEADQNPAENKVLDDGFLAALSEKAAGDWSDG